MDTLQPAQPPQPSQAPQTDHIIDIPKLLRSFLRYWYWIVLSMLIGFGLAMLQLRYTNDVFSAQAHIKILNDRETAEINIDLTKMTTRSSINLENEMALLKSFKINKVVAERLKLHVNYFREGRIKTWQVYRAPFVVEYQPGIDTTYRNRSFAITVHSKGYTLTNSSAETMEVEGFYFDQANAEFPISITPRSGMNLSVDEAADYVVSINTVEAAAKRLSQQLAIELYGEFSDILSISLTGYDTAYIADVLNTLIEVYTQDGITDRQLVSKRTIEFIDERFMYLTSELDSIETNKKNYKQRNDVSIFMADAGATLSSQETKNDRLFAVETQMLLAAILEKSLTKNEDFVLLPADIGLTSTSVNNLVGQYNTAVLDYNKLKYSAGSGNPTVQILRETIIELNANIASSLSAYKSQLEETLQQNVKAQGKVSSAFEALPAKEMVLRSIERQQNLKESLYVLLLQKREEAAIQMAIMAPNVKVVDDAIASNSPISPNRKKIYILGIMLGLTLPLGIIVLSELLNNRVYERQDIEKLDAQASVIGEIPLMTTEAQSQPVFDEQSTEAFRTLAHNLNFLWSGDSKSGKLVSVSSSIKGEGKTFIAYHLARACAVMEKRVLLIGADLRNPQLHSMIGIDKSGLGLTDFLSGELSDWKSLCIQPDPERPLDVLLSGYIPPMPSVLLSSAKFLNWLKTLRQEYDLVIIDTAPMIPVADTLTFAAHTDALVNVVRSGFSKNDLVQHAAKLQKDKKINNLVYVLNGIDIKRAYGYGYGYGYNYGYSYGYGSEAKRKAWYAFWK